MYQLTSYFYPIDTNRLLIFYFIVRRYLKEGELRWQKNEVNIDMQKITVARKEAVARKAA
jgi:hypothetical protein